MALADPRGVFSNRTGLIQAASGKMFKFARGCCQVGVSCAKHKPTPLSSAGGYIGGLGETMEDYDSSTSSETWPETSAAANSAGAKFVHVCTAVLSYALIDLVYTLNS